MVVIPNITVGTNDFFMAPLSDSTKPAPVIGPGYTKRNLKDTKEIN
jgi:hypothetical protein